MGRQTVSDFLVDTNGCCFICLSKVNNSDKVRSGSSSSSPYSSVHSLSQFLKLDMSKVFHDTETIPSELLENVKQSKLKAPLCKQCSKWNERISELCRHMKKIETEVTFYLGLVQVSLSKEDDRTDLLYHMDKGANLNGGSLEKMRIVKALRTETLNRCLRKLTTTNQIKVKIKNLSPNQIFLKRARIKAKSDGTSRKQGYGTSGTNVKYPGNIETGDSESNDNDSFYEPMDGTISEVDLDEDKWTSAGVNEGDDNLSIFKARPVSENRKRTNVTKSSSTKVLSLAGSGSTKQVQKLKYAINPETGKFKCNVCQVEITHRGDLRRHFDSIHLKIKRKCNACGKEFADQANYSRHHRTVHVGVRFKCNLCGRCFTTKTILVAHQQAVHLGIRLQCQFCPKSFVQKSNLAAHVRLSHRH